MSYLSLLYNIDICVCSEDIKQSHVFNEAVTRGYILLWNSHGHYDVLKGLVPPAAHTHAVSRQSFGASDEVWQILQRQYSFNFVAAFPEHFTYINILNNPVVTSTLLSMMVRAKRQRLLVGGCSPLKLVDLRGSSKQLRLNNGKGNTSSRAEGGSARRNQHAVMFHHTACHHLI